MNGRCLRVHAKDNEALGGSGVIGAQGDRVASCWCVPPTWSWKRLAWPSVVENGRGANALPTWMNGDAAEGKMGQYLYWRAASIFGGANEIQRTIIWGSLAR